MRPSVFFDRDDTLIRCRDVTPDGDLGDPALVELTPGAAEAVRAVKEAGFAVVVVSNQGGVARGRYEVTDVDAVNRRLNGLLGGAVDLFRFCPYHPEGSVDAFAREHFWRKPSPGMLLDASEVLGLDMARSWMVGDALRDCEAGRAAGVRTVLLSPEMRAMPDCVDFVARDLLQAAEIVLAHSPVIVDGEAVEPPM